MNKCKQCKRQIIYGDYRKKFCNHSCSAIYTNTKRGYKMRENSICKCGCKKCYESKACQKCVNKEKNTLCKINRVKFGNQTLGEFLNLHDGYTAQKIMPINRNSRILLKETNQDEKCANCGWNKHVQCAHKKPIMSFSKKTKIKIINSLNNLLWMCPNCHWLLDNNKLEMDL